MHRFTELGFKQRQRFCDNNPADASTIYRNGDIFSEWFHGLLL
jgi:hypothetical protein